MLPTGVLRTRAWAATWAVLRLVMAAALAAAVVAQLNATAATTIAAGRDLPLTIVNFFSFFTILSNSLTAVALLWAGTEYLSRGMRRRHPSQSGAFGPTSPEPRVLAVLLASVSTYMIITGIVYNVLLRRIELPPDNQPVPWSNEVLHLIGPLFLLLDVLVGSPRRALRWRAVWVVVAFPLAWLLYTMIRGPFVSNPNDGAQPPWYPYPFLDPANFDDGYLGVAVYIVGIAVAILSVAFVVVGIGRRRAASRA